MSSVASYYKLSPNAIVENVNDTNQEVTRVKLEGISFVVFPHVYPSQKFRTTGFVLRNLKTLVKGKKICDMGCGPGIIGLYTLHYGAKQVVQADINPNAVENAKENNLFHGYDKSQIKTYLSNCFDDVPKELFDLIVFNMPYHCDKIKIDDPLKYAFYDPAFASIKKFLKQARDYLLPKGQILIAFSDKGEIEILERLFTQAGYKWGLWKIINTDQEYDNRIYRLKLV